MITREQRDGRALTHIDLADGGRACIDDRGASLVELDLPGITDEEPLLWTGAGGRGSLASTGLRMVFPWFAGSRDGTKRPMHGVIDDAEWTLERMVDLPEGPELWWSIDHTGIHGAHVPVPEPFSAWAHHSFTGGPTLNFQVRNASANTTAQAVGALVALRVERVEACWLSGLGGFEWSGLDGISKETCIGDLLLDRPMARLFDRGMGPGELEVSLHDPVLDRTTTVRSEGTSEIFVWRPPFGLPDAEHLAAQGEFVLLGCLSVRRNIVRLMPGQTREAAISLIATSGS